MKEGEYTRKMLRDQQIPISEVVKRFRVSSAAAYQYFKSEQLTPEIRERFRLIFNIDTLGFRKNTEEINEAKTANKTAADYLASELINMKLELRKLREEIEIFHKNLELVKDPKERDRLIEKRTQDLVDLLDKII